jgi:integrase
VALHAEKDLDDAPENIYYTEPDVYYFTDADGHVKRREFLAEDLVPPDDFDASEWSKKAKSLKWKSERLKPGTLEIVNIRKRGEADKGVTIPAPKPGEPPLDIRVFTELDNSPAAEEDEHAADHRTSNDVKHASTQLDSSPSGDVAALRLSFTRPDLDQYIAYRSDGLAPKSRDWINRASQALWECTKGEISHQTMITLREFALEKYRSADSHSKVLSFAAAFLNFLAQTKIDTRYLSFTLFLQPPKAIRAKKALTDRIVTRADVEEVLKRIDIAGQTQKIGVSKTRNYRAFTLLAAYTGLRPSTIQRLTIGQFRAALGEDRSVLHVRAEQEKNRVEHYVPLHPAVVTAIQDVLTHDFEGKGDDLPLFMYYSFEKWVERQQIPLSRVRDPSKAHLWLSDFRKFAEQFGDSIGWDTTNRKYILAHGMTGVDWQHYKHPLPEDVYDTYMRFWREIEVVR